MQNPIFKTITARRRERVIRMGGWGCSEQRVRIRYDYPPSSYDADLGFRLCRTKD